MLAPADTIQFAVLNQMLLNGTEGDVLMFFQHNNTHSCLLDDAIFLGYDTALLGKQFPLFQWNIILLCSRVRISRSKRNRIFNHSNVETSGLSAVCFISYILVLHHSLSDLKLTHIVNNGFVVHMSITQYNSL
jgi:hypothetical protein